MGVHQRQRPVPKGHATRKIIVGQLLHAPRAKETKKLRTCNYSNPGTANAAAIHSFFFFNLALLFSFFAIFFVAVFLEGHTSRGLGESSLVILLHFALTVVEKYQKTIFYLAI